MALHYCLDFSLFHLPNPMFCVKSLQLASRRFNSTLVIIEHQGERLALSNLNSITAAATLGNPITCLVTGTKLLTRLLSTYPGGDTVAKLASALPGVSKVLSCSDDSLKHALPEYHSPLITKCANDLGFTHVVCAHTSYAKNVFPRAGALLNVSPVPDVIEITSQDTFKRPIYAGNAIATVKSTDAIKLITVRTTAFAPSAETGGSATIEAFSPSSVKTSTVWQSDQVAKSDRPELGAAKVVISGGRGMKNGENFEMLYKLADKIGGAGTFCLI